MRASSRPLCCRSSLASASISSSRMLPLMFRPSSDRPALLSLDSLASRSRLYSSCSVLETEGKILQRAWAHTHAHTHTHTCTHARTHTHTHEHITDRQTDTPIHPPTHPHTQPPTLPSLANLHTQKNHILLVFLLQFLDGGLQLVLLVCVHRHHDLHRTFQLKQTSLSCQPLDFITETHVNDMSTIALFK